MEWKLCEIHPEVCSIFLNVGEPMGHNKKKASGQAERLAVLSRCRPDAEIIFQEARAGWRKKELSNGDILMHSSEQWLHLVQTGFSPCPCFRGRQTRYSMMLVMMMIASRWLVIWSEMHISLSTVRCHDGVFFAEI